MPNYFNRSGPMQTAAFGGTTSPVQIVAGSGTKTIQIHYIALANLTAQTVQLQDSAASPVNMTGALPMAANGNIVLPMNPSGEPLFTCTAGKAFQAATSTSAAIAGFVMYTQA